MMTLGHWHNPLPASTGAKLYDAACLPRLLYGLEACDITKASVAELEATHRSCALRLQGLPVQTAIPVPLATLGWMRIQAAIDVLKMNFVYGLLLLPYACVYKRVVIARLAYHIFDSTGGKHGGPIHQAYETCCRYRLAGYILEILNTGQGMTMCAWKRLVNTTVRDHEQTRWQMTCPMYKKLTLFPSAIVSCNRMWVWWHIGRRQPDMSRAARVLLRLLCLGVNTGEFGRQRRCVLCPLYRLETAEHLLFDCEHFAETRSSLWGRTLESMPDAMRETVEVMTSQQKCAFIFSGAHSQYTTEWTDIYKNMADFVVALYTQRRDINAAV